MGATLASLPTAVWAHLLSGGESISSSSGGGGGSGVDFSAQHHLQSLSQSDAFHQCGSNPPPLLQQHFWEAQVDMDYSSAAAAQHYMMAPHPPPPDSHSSLAVLSPQQVANVYPQGQWTSSRGEHLQSSSLMRQHHEHHHQQQQHQHQRQLSSGFQEQFGPHPHMLPNAHVAHLAQESPDEGRGDAAKRSAAAGAAAAPIQGNGEEIMSTSDSYKRPRLELPATPLKTQVRKEKLGERITALQQLVSPFGKTDTASVLQEAIGYIKFLQDQVQVLSTPYMKPTMSSGSMNHHDSQSDPGNLSSWGASSNLAKSTQDGRQDLRSRGLCLVPVSCTLQLANDNGADFWTPAIGGSGCR